METVGIHDESDIVSARQRVRELARDLGFSQVDMTLIATAVSELTRNILEFAKEGRISFGVIHDPARDGILIVAEDHGPGIVDVEMALQNGYSTRKSLGMGLPGTRRLMDSFRVDSAPGRGTKVMATKWIS